MPIWAIIVISLMILGAIIMRIMVFRMDKEFIRKLASGEIVIVNIKKEKKWTKTSTSKK